MSHIIRELLKATNLVLRLENVGIFLGTTGRAASTPHTQQIPGEKSKCNEIPNPFRAWNQDLPSWEDHQSPGPDFNAGHEGSAPLPASSLHSQHGSSTIPTCPSVQAVQVPFWQEHRAKTTSQTGLRNPCPKDSAEVSTGKGSSEGKMEGGAGTQNLWGCLDGADFYIFGKKAREAQRHRLLGFDLGRAGARAPGSHSSAPWPPKPPKSPCPELCPLLPASPQAPAGFVPHQSHHCPS